MYQITFVNMGYTSDRRFDTIVEAKAFCIECNFEARVELNGNVVAIYSPISGFQLVYNI